MKKKKFPSMVPKQNVLFFGHVISLSLNKLVHDGWRLASFSLLTAISRAQKSKKGKWSITLNQSRHFDCDLTMWRLSLFSFRKRRELREARNQY